MRSEDWPSGNFEGSERVVSQAQKGGIVSFIDYVASTKAVTIYRDGREVCMSFGVVRQSKQGRNEYRYRIALMAERQGSMCCLYGFCPDCPGSLIGYVPTFEHEHGRGGGKRDDRIVLPDGTWQNGAAHLACNNWKGSRYIAYNASISGMPHKSH